MRASKRSIARWVLVAALLTRATSRAQATERGEAAPPDPPPAEMLLELDLFADPGFDRRSSARSEGSPPGGREPLEEFDLGPDADDSRPESRPGGR
jgi:hypothetical protein